MDLARVEDGVKAVRTFQNEDAGIGPIIQWIVHGSFLWPS